MTLVAALVLAAAVPAERAEPSRESDRGAEVESARIAVTILQPAVLKGGVLWSDANTPRIQRREKGGSVTYAFE